MRWMYLYLIWISHSLILCVMLHLQQFSFVWLMLKCVYNLNNPFEEHIFKKNNNTITQLKNLQIVKFFPRWNCLTTYWWMCGSRWFPLMKTVFPINSSSNTCLPDCNTLRRFCFDFFFCLLDSDFDSIQKIVRFSFE